MSVEEQFRSQSLELDALKNRVRNFRQTKHWQTDGEWKESVLRTILRRHLPRHIEPLRGFVTDGNWSTRQIDVLLYDSTKPALFRDGDLIFVTPDAVAGIIEVKSSISTMSKLEVALRPLAANIAAIRKRGNSDTFAALFAFDTSLDAESLRSILNRLNSISRKRQARVIDIVSLGSSVFVLNWEGSLPDSKAKGDRWHAYYLPTMAPGYFVGNVVYLAAPTSVQGHIHAWFPKTPKEVLGLEQGHPKQEPEDLGFGVIVYGTKNGGR